MGKSEPIHVGYLSYDDALDLIVLSRHPDFALEYAPELRAELYRLTYGQPYLLQRLCWELVERWNERFLRAGRIDAARADRWMSYRLYLPRTFTASADHYFTDGVW